MKRLAPLILCLTLLSSEAHAGFFEWLQRLYFGPGKDYGSWLCTDCQVADPGDPTSVVAIPYVGAFIKFNNDAIHGGESVKIWKGDSQITICDGKNCITVYYVRATDLWLPKGPTKPDPKTGYKGTGPGTAQVAPPPLGGPYLVITYSGPATTIQFDTDVQITVVPSLNLSTPVTVPARTYTGTVTSGPITVVGPAPEATQGAQQQYSDTIGPGKPESFQPDPGADPTGGNGGGGGCALAPGNEAAWYFGCGGGSGDAA